MKVFLVGIRKWSGSDEDDGKKIRIVAATMNQALEKARGHVRNTYANRVGSIIEEHKDVLVAKQ